MRDYSDFQTTDVIPDAASMIETFRAIGYNIENAISDIIDNSISAKANNIFIDFEWAGSLTWISIKDDGCGMDSSEILVALKPGSKNPLQNRDAGDLGRFGMGLKTASFSQAKTLTVISKKEQAEITYWTWDLDYIQKTSAWRLVKWMPENISIKSLDSLKSGTLVIWTNLDRIVGGFSRNDEAAKEKFYKLMENTKKHISMVFHRFIENKSINIFINDRIIMPWNPFAVNNLATYSFPDEKLSEGRVLIKGYVLPHKSKMSESEYNNLEGVKGWNEQQGFYLYRGNRMILFGGWLNLFRREEHYKLARISLDIPNTIDADWQIDIKKSIARPPLSCKDQIKSYALKVRSQAVEVYRHRGKNIKNYSSKGFIPLWIEHKKDNKWYFKVNREHPIVEKSIRETKINPNKAIEILLNFIEESIPIKSIYIKEAESGEFQQNQFDNISSTIILDNMKAIYLNMIENGKNGEEAKRIISNTEPFNQYLELLEQL